MKLRKKFLASVLVFIFILQASPPNDTGRVGSVKSQGREPNENLTIKVKRYVRSQHLNGSIAIVNQGKLLFNEGSGISNSKTGTLNNAATTFPIASITKLFVATAILQLQEKGLLKITDPVSKYIPKFSQAKEIRLIHLLNQTSGIKTPALSNEDTKPIQIINRIQLNQIKFPAGTRWDYNDINYIVLGYIVEKVSGTSLHQYIQENIFDKAQMLHSGFITHKTPKAYTSFGHHRHGNRLIQANPLNIVRLFGCADIYATAYDICLFDRALMGGSLVSKDSLRMLLTPNSHSNYGLGLYVKNNKIYSRGVVDGFESFHVYYLDGTAITILLNIRDKSIDIHQISKDLYELTKQI